ncbi:MAG: VOC family protein [Actinomycetota bacterium]|nr:VOC family protein [Actinomycetota bacterium]
MAIGVQATFDAHDPGRLAAFWGEALGYTEQPPPPGFATWEDFGRHIDLPEERWGDFAALVDPDGVGPRLLFQRVPEGKMAKNRMHLDLDVGAQVSDPEQRRSVVRRRAEQLAAAGGAVVREVDEPGGWCVVMTDPEGNEFCVQ